MRKGKKYDKTKVFSVNKNKMMKEHPVLHKVHKKTKKVPENNFPGPARLNQESDFGHFNIRNKRLFQ